MANADPKQVEAMLARMGTPCSPGLAKGMFIGGSNKQSNA
jgi:hypothetical protein